MIKKFIYITLLTITCNFVGYAQDTMVKNAENKEVMMSTSIVSAEDAAKAALNVGAKMPAFNLKDARGQSISSEDLLKQGNLVVVFYRGSWCPYCNLYLKKLQQNLPQIKDNKGTLVAISVENPDNSLTIAKKNEVSFTVLSDPNLTVARKFGIVYQLPKETDETYKNKYGLDIAKHNEMEKPELSAVQPVFCNQVRERRKQFHLFD